MTAEMEQLQPRGVAAEGRTESPLHTLDETVSIMRTIDTALAALS